jgi:hypothetical protein
MKASRCHEASQIIVFKSLGYMLPHFAKHFFVTTLERLFIPSKEL